jgi:hypothetical protein
MTWIQTYTGRQFFPLAPRAEDVHILDIAHALALKCRFTGHTKYMYSVAQHSLLCAAEATRNARIHALLHDAAEAYLFDAATPIKSAFPLIADLEAAILAAVYTRYDIPQPTLMQRAEVDFLDKAMLAREAYTFFWPAGNWDIQAEPADVTITEKPWREVEESFLLAFDDCHGPHHD